VSRAGAPRTVDDYVACAPREVRRVLERIRAIVRAAAPNAVERLSYGMPAYFENGALVYFGAFRRHIGFYPPVRSAALAPAIRRYTGPGGNLRFPLDAPIPYRLIARVVAARRAENRARTRAKARRGKAAAKRR
jgi:uncharacterized protein YdhG (YjbR/CyaY superfamily)